jgi:FixJ family two-component response regulator
MRMAAQGLLNSHGLRTQGFPSAEQFLQSRDGCKAGCLVLDMRLPGMSGLELQQELRVRGLAIPAIFVTAEPDTDLKLQTQILRCGAMAVLRKPFDPERLAQLVQAAFESQRQP